MDECVVVDGEVNNCYHVGVVDGLLSARLRRNGLQDLV